MVGTTVGNESSGSLVGVIGAGTMGAGIAQLAVQAGHTVAVYDALDGAAARAVEGIGKRLDSLAAKGRIAAEEAQAGRDRLRAIEAPAELEDAVLVVEAVVEDLGVKQKLFAELEGIVGPDCLLATNTSSLSISAIAGALREPERLVGMHFFNPAPLMPLVEVIEGLATAPELSAAVAALAQAWGKTTVHCRSTPGFIVNRVARPFYAEALRAYEEQAADIATIDAVLRESGGFKMGPFELMDMIGLDVNLAVSTSVWEATGYDPRYTPAWTQKEHVAAKRLGRKSGRGFYEYGEGVEKAAPSYADTLGLERYPAPRLHRSHGKTATSYGDGRILIDIVIDPDGMSTVAIAPAADTPDDRLQEAIVFLQAMGKKVVILEDVPGLVATRTVARLVNEAVDALYRGDADEEDIDTAMKLGVNYPKGPLEWGEDLGFGYLCEVLDNLEDVYRDGRYRASPLLRQLAQADRLMDAPLSRAPGAALIEELAKDSEADTLLDDFLKEHDPTQNNPDQHQDHQHDNPDKDPA
ncbi:3-hydroxyacyl-CoA dehydrogenase NAD-binding domain-containing protein [Catenulispora pinisilvae]|uniref:3-hydroxyacyl-CoA dehydrogenase NAD-binding domain-containing protein n=1 Tax=Catenulispora pinisilvae TaxID=2705253 RepID=UPI001E498A56|nr:3-hydroxyacyl-CoA dehydrogenase NAD-binding domain-containing protein [Catenulispora pinisilvae]